MFRSFFASRKYFWKAWGRGAFLIALTVLNVWMNMKVGREIGIISKILEHVNLHHFMDFTKEVWWLIFFRFVFVLSDPTTQYQSRIFAIDWRKAITENFIPRWGNIVGKTTLKGVSQRLQEEPYGFSKFFDSMGFQLLHSLLAVFGFGYEIFSVGPTVIATHHAIDVSLGLVPFIALAVFIQDLLRSLFVRRGFRCFRSLIILGFGFVFCRVGPTVAHIHYAADINVGWLPIIAFGVFIAGLAMAVLLGYKVPRMENHNRDKETIFREVLVLIEDGKEPYSKEGLISSFRKVYQSYVNMFWWTIPLDTWKSLYWNSIAVIPYMIGGYWIFARVITLGDLPQIAQNFEQCMGGLSLFINNWRQIVDFIATKNRLQLLEDALDGKEPSVGTEVPKRNPWSMM
ncbi:MAG: hypothetical protein HYT94_01625 [Parcubacteria group bacterium]|nr:hypothetical protein [Parcubacteria group bacterium]